VRRWLLAVSGIFLLFFGVLLLPPVQTALAKRLWKLVRVQSGLNVVAQSVQWQWPLGLSLHHAVLRDSSDRPLVHLAEVNLRGPWFAPGLGFSAASLQIKGGTVLLERPRKDSTFTLLSALAPLLEGPPAPQPTPWKISKLELRNVQILLRDQHQRWGSQDLRLNRLLVHQLGGDPEGVLRANLKELAASSQDRTVALRLAAQLTSRPNGAWSVQSLDLHATGLTASGAVSGKGMDTLNGEWKVRGEVASLLRWPRWLGMQTDTLPNTGVVETSGVLAKRGAQLAWKDVRVEAPGISLNTSGSGNYKTELLRTKNTKIQFNTSTLLNAWPQSFFASVREQIQPQWVGVVRTKAGVTTRSGWVQSEVRLQSGEFAQLNANWTGSVTKKEELPYRAEWAVSVPEGSVLFPDSLEVGPVLAQGTLNGVGYNPETWSASGALSVEVARFGGYRADGLRAQFDLEPHLLSAGWNWNNSAVQAHGAHEFSFPDSAHWEHRGEFTSVQLDLRSAGLASAPEGRVSGKWSYSFAAENANKELEFKQMGANWRNAQGGHPLGALTATGSWNEDRASLTVRGDALDLDATVVGNPSEVLGWWAGPWEERLAGQTPKTANAAGASGNLRVLLKKTDSWMDLVDTSSRCASGTLAQWSLRSNGESSWEVVAPRAQSQGFRVYGVRISGSTSRGSALARVEVDSLSGYASYSLVRWVASNGTGTLEWSVKGPAASGLAFSGSSKATYQTDGRWLGRWGDGSLHIPGDVLQTAAGATWSTGPRGWESDPVRWSGERGGVWFGGDLSAAPDAQFQLGVEGLPLSLAKPWLDSTNTQLAGRVSAQVSVQSPLGTPGIQGSLGIDSLVWNREWMGTMTGSADYSKTTKISTIGLALDRGERKTLSVRASYDPQAELWPVEATVHVDRLRLMALQPYLAGTLDRFRGTVRGEVKFQWSESKYLLTGELELPSFAASVPLLGTDYGVDGVPRLTLGENQWTLHPVVVRDTKERTQGSLSATFRPNKFKDPRLDLTLELVDLLALDLPTSDLFFGKVYAKGTVKVLGPLDALRLDVRAEAAKPSVFKLPLSTPTEYEANSSISFVRPIQEAPERIRTTVARGLDVSLALQVTPLMTMELLLDETVGDIIRGNGVGWMKVDYPPTGALRLNGSVELTGGSYLFTLQNLINKSFDVAPGGTLAWTGDPYGGRVNLRAVYTTRTALTGMVNQPDYGGQRVPVQLGLNLTGDLMQPQLGFDFALPNANPAWQEELRNRLADGDKRNIQAFSLLLTNAFWQSNEGLLSQSVQSVNANTTQMLASQFSNFLAQGLGDFVDIDLAYSGSNRSDARDQLEVALSKAFLNDRVSVQTTLDVPLGRQDASSTTSGLVGDVQVNYKITEDGRWKARAFNRSNNNNPALDRLSPYTQGVGLEFGTQANSWKALFRRRKKAK
jgi:hypothetical protein